MITIGFLYWLLLILWLIFGGWVYWSPPNWRPLGGHILVWILFALLGVEVFGFPISR